MEDSSPLLKYHDAELYLRRAILCNNDFWNRIYDRIEPVLKNSPFAGVIVSALLLAACGSTSSSVPLNLSPDAKTGRELSISSGCASCHGSNGEGRVGPQWIDLADSQVLLSDGTTVTADDSYLYESIKNPDAKRRRGATSMMPAINLSDTEIASIISYIRALAD